MVSLDKRTLTEFLTELQGELSRKISVVTVGGTAMTLLDLKPSTIDVDFTIPSKHYDEFRRALKAVPHGFEVHCWPNGMVFNVQLPDDYLKKSVVVRSRMKKIVLRALSPLDIVVTKIARLDERDFQDIQACVTKYGLTKPQILARARTVEYVGREENYEINLTNAISRLFDRRPSNRTRHSLGDNNA
ncbi:MAG: DUF6036 family nucleotidyltransferase [Aigarchaeota archaeon]|nr:DUF6036 family nucleotidyltransferase [Aigarchaeota archaeon]